MTPEFNKKNVLKWMRDNASDYADVHHTGEVDMTMLAEAAAEHFDQKDEGGPLDDESHWIWELALQVADEMTAP